MEKMQFKSLAELVSVAERIGLKSATRQPEQFSQFGTTRH